MSSGAYAALSGLRTRAEQLERLAADLANVGTAGYKAERGSTAEARRPADAFGAALQSAIDVTGGPTSVDFRPGAITPTGRDLDLAIDGQGFFVVETPEGPRYTRNGHFTRRPDGVLATVDGHPVLGESGPIRLPADAGVVTVAENGELRAGETPVGRLKVVDVEAYQSLSREDGARFRTTTTVTPAAGGVRVVGGALEKSNVAVVDRMAQLTSVSRGFEALQRGVTIMFNDLDGRAISELGRR